VTRTKTSLSLKWLAIALTLAVLAAPTVRARAAGSIRGSATTASLREVPTAGPKAGSRHVIQNQYPSKRSTASYLWAVPGIAAAVPAGLLLLGLWGDVAIGGVLAGIVLLTAGAGLTVRKTYVRVRRGFGGGSSHGTPTDEQPMFGARA